MPPQQGDALLDIFGQKFDFSAHFKTQFENVPDL
jgi:hypothetical protein